MKNSNGSVLPSLISIFRYMELVHPIWHKTHFRIRWIYLGLVLDLVLIMAFYATKNALITKVTGLYLISLTVTL